MFKVRNASLKPCSTVNEQYPGFKRIPDDTVFACAYTAFINPIDFCETLFYRRINGSNELWVATCDVDLDPHYEEKDHSDRTIYDQFRCRLSIPAEGSMKQACQDLLYYNFRMSINHSFPSRFILTGLLSEKDYGDVVQTVTNELKVNADAAEQNVSEIVLTAKELGLYPAATGLGPHSWRAGCPGTSHPIWIDTKENIFGCPWCRKKGGPDLLREFVEELRAKKKRVQGR